jgi:NAD(P)H-dependent FMN reductase
MLIPALALVMMSCCAGRQAQTGPGAITGIIVIIGNEPFTTPALQVADGTIHRLTCSKQLEQTLRSVQGKRVRVAVSKADTASKEMHITEAVVLTEEQGKGTP